MGWTNPWVLSGLIGGVALLGGVLRRSRPRSPTRCSTISLFKIRAFAGGNLAGLLAAIGRGGLQFMLIIWLQGIWLPLHGYSYDDTPLWAGIYLLPLTVGFLVAGPLSGYLSDRFGRATFAVGGLLLVAASFIGLLLLPIELPLLGLRAPDRPQRHRLGPVLGAEHDRGHEQRPGRSARRGRRHARHVLQLRHGALDRHLLLADDRRSGLDRCRRRCTPG